MLSEPTKPCAPRETPTTQPSLRALSIPLCVPLTESLAENAKTQRNRPPLRPPCTPRDTHHESKPLRSFLTLCLPLTEPLAEYAQPPGKSFTLTSPPIAPLSYWEQDAFWRDLDAVVIGGGLVGTQAAIHLRTQRPDWRVVQVEGSAGPLGASTRNAGFACFGSLTELLDDLQHHPPEAVWDLVAMRWRGLRYLRDTLGETAIGYQGWGGLEVFTEADEASYQRCLAQMDQVNAALRDLVGQSSVFVQADDRIGALGLGRTRHLIVNQAEGQLHPGRLMRRLLDLARAHGVARWTGLPITDWTAVGDAICLQTAAGWEIQARRVLVATNGFAQRLLPDLPVQPARNQILLTEPIPGLRLRGAFHYDRGYVYFRDVGQRVLIGGARNLDPHGEHTDILGESPTIQAHLQQLLQEMVIPNHPVQIAQQWSGILGVGPQKLPIIEALAPNLVVAVRLGGMGVAIGGEVGRQAAAKLLAAG